MPVWEMISRFPKRHLQQILDIVVIVFMHKISQYIMLMHTSEVYQIDILAQSVHISFIINDTLEILKKQTVNQNVICVTCIGQLSPIERTDDNSGGSWTLGECTSDSSGGSWTLGECSHT